MSLFRQKGEDLLQGLATTNSLTYKSLKVMFLLGVNIRASHPHPIQPYTKLGRSHRMIPNDQTSEGRPIFTAPCLTASRGRLLRMLGPIHDPSVSLNPLDMSPLGRYSRYAMFLIRQYIIHITKPNTQQMLYNSIFETNKKQ